MIRNKAIKALIIGTCMVASSMTGVFADTDQPVAVPAIMEQAENNGEEMTIQILSATNDDALTQKHAEIDKYIFAEHLAELEAKGIFITHTGVVGDVVEIGISPYDQKSVDYLYELFGKDMVQVVAGENSVPLEYIYMSGEAQTQEEPSFFGKIFNSIVEFFKNIF